MKIQVFGKDDVKKSGGFKKKNNVKNLTEQEFKDYVRSNNLVLSKGYIDDKGFLSNGLRFRCFYNNLIVGVSKIVEELNSVVKE